MAAEIIVTNKTDTRKYILSCDETNLPLPLARFPFWRERKVLMQGNATGTVFTRFNLFGLFDNKDWIPSKKIVEPAHLHGPHGLHYQLRRIPSEEFLEMRQPNTQD
jgi:hypothetical protein